MITLNPIITNIRRTGPLSVLVQFTSPHARIHQLYIGRRLAAETAGPTARTIETQLTFSRYPQWLSIAAVEASDIGQDRGAWLPPRPYNVVRIQFDQSGWSGDAHEIDVRRFDVLRGDTPGGALNSNNIIASVLAEDANATYEIETDPLPGSGEWNLGVRGLDTTEETGNPGTTAEFTATVLATPPDFDNGFDVSLSSGTATITATIPED